MIHGGIRAFAPVVVLVASTSVGHASDVRTVGPTGQNFTSIQSAIDASVDGDIVLVKSGVYFGFAINGKAVHIAADQGATVTLTTAITIQNLAAAQQVTLSGFTNGGGMQLNASNLAGSLRANGCSFHSPLGQVPPPAVLLTNCADVALSHCTVTGGNGQFGPAVGLHFGSGGMLALDHTSIVGGIGAPGGHVMDTGFSGGPGGVGARILGTKVFLSGSTITGGQGGPGAGGSCTSPLNFPTGGGPGGLGLDSDGATTVRLLASTIAGGPGGGGGSGFPGACQQPNGAMGQSIGSPPGALVQIPGTSRELEEIAPVRAGTSLALTLHGQPGDRAFLASSLQPAHAFVASSNGVQLYAQPTRRIFLGTVGAGGVLNVSLPIPAFSGGLLGATRNLQAAFLDVANQTWLATSVHLVMLDSSF